MVAVTLQALNVLVLCWLVHPLELDLSRHMSDIFFFSLKVNSSYSGLLRKFWKVLELSLLHLQMKKPFK